MSSFWNFFGGKDENEKPQEDAVEQPPAAPPAARQASQPPQQRDARREREREAGQPPEPKVAPQLPAKNAPPRYGIDDAIKLMRTLPVDENADLVVRVIKRTLESLEVKVPDIVEDAKKRQDGLRAKITEYQQAIVQFEREIDARRHEIGRLEDELQETTTVRERLELAEATPFSVTPTPMRTTTTSPAATTGANKKVEFPAPPPVATKDAAPGPVPPPVPHAHPTTGGAPPSSGAPPRTAPPLPAFRPKMSGADAQKKAPSIPPPAVPVDPGSSPSLAKDIKAKETKDKDKDAKNAKDFDEADFDDEIPVESRDLVDSRDKEKSDKDKPEKAEKDKSEKAEKSDKDKDKDK